MKLSRLVMALALGATLLAASPAAAQQIYWLDTRFAAPTLNRANPNGTSPVSLALPAGSLPEGLVVDPVTRQLYWTEAAFGGARVRRCALDFAFPTDVVTGGSALRGIAVDGPGGQLYWTTSNMVTGPNIRRSSITGSALTTFLTLGAASNPRGIAYSALPAPASLYVCDPASDALFKYSTAGSGGLLLGLTTNSRPYGIAVDGAGGRVYFTEYGRGRIERCVTDGSGQTLLQSGLSNPTYIAIDPQGGTMYWVEGGAGSQKVMRAPLAGGATVNLGLPLTTYGGIAFAPASLITGVDGAPPVLELALGAITPNPASGEARIDFALPNASHVRLSAFDVQGREVAVLVDGLQEAGRHIALLEGATLRAGMYFVRLRTGGVNLTRRLVLVR